MSKPRVLGRRSFVLGGGLIGAALLAACGGKASGASATGATSPPPTMPLAASAAVVGSSPAVPRPGTVGMPATTPTARATAVSGAALYFPPNEGETWETVAPSAVGWDAARLDAALDFAAEQHSTAVVILHRGRMMAERYWQGWDSRRVGLIGSASKSVVATLVGIAQDEGRLTIADSVTKHLGAGWSGATAAQEAAITVRHLLTMTSGLDEDLGFAVPPGTRWDYKTPAYYKLKGILSQVSGMSLNAYTASRLTGPVGMARTTWRPRTLFASARDMARFGLLTLAGGVWRGRAIVRDAAYLAAATRTSQPLNPAYGYLWWLNGKASYLLPGSASARPGPLIPAAPPDLVAALGFGDKKIYVVPSLELVIARHGGFAEREEEQGQVTFDSAFWARLMAAAPGR